MGLMRFGAVELDSDLFPFLPVFGPVYLPAGLGRWDCPYWYAGRLASYGCYSGC